MSSFPVNPAIAATHLTEFIASPSEPIELDHPFADLPRDLCSDEPSLETDLHLLQIKILLDCLNGWWQERTDFYAKILSDSTANIDFPSETLCERGLKKQLYQDVFRTPNQRAEKLAAKLRELGVDPDCL
uniref:Uma2 family endonuclease n=1 Tax=Cyanothece sp. (strain PCC 7425 / ATCC 29141) TaxID=395961 RepID=B8HLW7_CYAP4